MYKQNLENLPENLFFLIYIFDFIFPKFYVNQQKLLQNPVITLLPSLIYNFVFFTDRRILCFEKLVDHEII